MNGLERIARKQLAKCIITPMSNGLKQRPRAAPSQRTPGDGLLAARYALTDAHLLEWVAIAAKHRKYAGRLGKKSMWD